MGMHCKTAYNHRQRALSALRDLYSRAEHFGLTSAEICDARLAIFDTLKACPQRVKAYLEGWEQAQRDAINRKVVFCYNLPDGRRMSTHKDRADYYEKNGIGPAEIYNLAVSSGHYWAMPNGELRPYYVSTDK